MCLLYYLFNDLMQENSIRANRHMVWRCYCAGARSAKAIVDAVTEELTDKNIVRPKTTASMEEFLGASTLPKVSCRRPAPLHKYSFWRHKHCTCTGSQWRRIPNLSCSKTLGHASAGHPVHQQGQDQHAVQVAVDAVLGACGLRGGQGHGKGADRGCQCGDVPFAQGRRRRRHTTAAV